MDRVANLIDSRPFRVVFALIAVATLVAGVVVYFQQRADESLTADEPRAILNSSPKVDKGEPITPPQTSLKVAREFVATAVLRRDLERSWQLTAPQLKGSFTKEKWLTGSIPVVPYPAAAFDKAAFEVSRAFEKEIVLYVRVQPKPGADVKPQTFVLKLVPSGEAWLVSYWAPRGGSAVPATP